MAKPVPAKAAETKYGVLFTNHKPEQSKASLTRAELGNHACMHGYDVPALLQQQHTPLFEEVGIDISVECRQPNCPHQ